MNPIPQTNASSPNHTPTTAAVLWALVRQRCPRCCQGRIFKSLFAMNDPCPVCGMVFEREPGYFLGAMYFSYFLAVLLMGVFYLVVRVLFPEMDTIVTALVAVLPYLPLVPFVFRYSRVIWIHFDRWVSPTEVSSHDGHLRWRDREEQRKEQ